MPLFDGTAAAGRSGIALSASLRLCALLLASQSIAVRAGDSWATVTNGVITYTLDDGKTKTIDVGKKCTDLWTDPDGNVMAFIAIEQEKTPPRNPSLGYDEGPTIEQSSLYIARRSDHFAPLRLPVKPILIYGREWSVMRRPSVSPDRMTVLFEVPDSVVTSMLMSLSLNSGVLQQIGDGSDYCVIWHGAHAGGLLLQRRYVRDDANPGVSHRCYLLDAPGATKMIEDKCDSLEDFAKEWSQRNGASCTPPVFSEWHH